MKPGYDVFAKDLGAPEGPVALPGGAMYVTEMAADALRITHIDPAGRHRVVTTTGGRPNGLTIDGDGHLWIAEAGQQAVVCIDPEGNEILRIEGSQEAGPFLFPNDLAFGPNGHLYVTDSGMRIGDFLDDQDYVENYLDLPWDGRVYEIDPKEGKVLRVLDRGIRFTNGIAFDAQNRLYVNASFPGDIYRYDVFGSDAPKREFFSNVVRSEEVEGAGFKGPDGMKFGMDGRLYCTVFGQGDITVVNPDGSIAERLTLVGPNPTNCVFLLESNVLRVTEIGLGQVESLPMPCAGLPLHKPKLGR